MASDLKNVQNQAPQGKAHDADIDLKSVVEQQAKDISELRQMLLAQLNAKPLVSPDTIWAKEHEKAQKIKDELAALAVLFLKSCVERTQWEANKLNPEGKRLYKVCVGWCPELVIRANDTITAKAYYDKVCGINSVTTNHSKPATTTYRITDVTDDAAAQAQAKGAWESKVAA